MPPNWISVTAKTTPVLALPENRNRVWIILYNQGSQTVYWSHDSTVTSTTGGPLPQNSAVSLAEIEYDHTHEPIFLVTGSSTSDVRVYEGTRELSPLASLFSALR